MHYGNFFECMASDPPLRERRMIRGWAHGFRSSAKGKKYDKRLGPWPPVLRCGEEVRRGGGRERQSSEILPRVTLLFLNVREERNTAARVLVYLNFCVTLYAVGDIVYHIIHTYCKHHYSKLYNFLIF
jgi:hypothetical protein